jgi:hypothetical protein
VTENAKAIPPSSFNRYPAGQAFGEILRQPAGGSYSDTQWHNRQAGRIFYKPGGGRSSCAKHGPAAVAGIDAQRLGSAAGRLGFFAGCTFAQRVGFLPGLIEIGAFLVTASRMDA